jgi:dienelactone hydrolase
MQELAFITRPEADIPTPVTLPVCFWANNHVVARFPSRVDLRPSVEGRRSFAGYDEWKLSFDSEPAEGLPDPTLARVCAYLLVPTDELFAQPYPAVVCFHQCGRDCDIGKESVVGKAVDRPDQAYGLELVQQGFAVLAPESINCGERIIRSIRTAGTPAHRWSHAQCWNKLGRFVPWGLERWKKAWDGIRAVDVLRSLPFVDPDKIAVVGHSMGSGTALDTLIADARVRAGILSSGGCNETDRALAAPRLLIQQQATLDANARDLAAVPAAQARGRQVYETLGVSGERFAHHVVAHGHHFSEEFKIIAYRQLKEHFGMIRTGEPVSILGLVEETVAALEKREDLWWCWHTRAANSKLPPLTLGGDRACVTRADRARLLRAFETTLVPLLQKIPHGSCLDVWVDNTPDGAQAVFTIAGGNDATRSAHETLLRQAAHHFAHAGAQLIRSHSLDTLFYKACFPGAARVPT